MTKWRLRLAIGAACAGLVASATGVAGAASRAPDAGNSTPQLRVSGNHLVNASGRRVVLHGVDRSGGEYTCVHGFGIWDGPMNEASVRAVIVGEIGENDCAHPISQPSPRIHRRRRAN